MLTGILTMFGIAALFIIGVGGIIGVPIVLAVRLGFEGDRMRAEQEQRDAAIDAPLASITSNVVSQGSPDMIAMVG